MGSVVVQESKKKNERKVVIVIPVYKKDLLPDESISLRQVFRILSRYDICFAAPKGLTLDYEEIENESYAVEYFEQDYFTSLEGYSRLCTSVGFYERFNDYDFMLIYQLDAFVFSDRLIEFCESGYDYWGAPVPKVYWEYMPVSVGNGGFSLRRISSFLKITKRREEIIDIINDELPDYWKKDFIKNEDELLIYGSNLFPETRLKIPPEKDAFDFSTEFNIDCVYDDLETHVPFGCHRWARYKFDKWWPIISKFGYELENEYVERLKGESRDDSYNRLVLYGLLQETTDLHNLLEFVLGDDTVSIWGLGRNAEKIINIILTYGLKVGNRYDKNANEHEGALFPERGFLAKEVHPIVITSTKYETEIRKEIKEMNPDNDLLIYNSDSLYLRFLERLEIDRIGESHHFRNGSFLPE